MKKQIIWFVVALIIMTLFCCSSAMAAEIVASGTCRDNLTWTLDNEGTLRINGEGKIALYSTGKTPWYSYRSSIRSVIINYGITSIGGQAFQDCSNLTNIEIPNSVTSISGNAFCKCTSLENIIIPDSVTSIGGSAFNSCYNLVHVEIPNSVTEIGNSAFISCIKLETINIPEGVLDIGDFTFYNCKNLSSVTMPNSLTSIGFSAFGNCSNLLSVIIPDNVENIGNQAFAGCARLRSVILPNQIRRIGFYTFSDCVDLESIIIPDSITSIDEEAFYNCPAVFYSHIEAEGAKALSRSGHYFREPNGKCFYKYIYENEIIKDLEIRNVDKDVVDFNIPFGVTSISASSFNGCINLKRVIIPSSITTIGKLAFRNCTSLMEITIPDDLSYVSSDSFENCPALLFAHLDSNGAKSLGKAGFSFREPNGNCIYEYKFNNNILNDLIISCVDKDVISFTIPSGVTAIDDNSFKDCADLLSVIIPDTVNHTGTDVFSGCTNLTNVALSNNMTVICSGFFKNCISLKTIIIPESISQINNDSFYGCNNLSDIVVSAENSSFCSIDGILYDKAIQKILCYPAGKTNTSYSLPSSVTEIGSYAFCGCIRLANIIFSDNIDSIGSNAFEECPAIIEFGDCGADLIWILDCKGILRIFGSGEMAEYASYADTSWYDSLDKIRSVVIYNRVTSIGQHAFHNCINLTNIIIPDSISSIGKYAFCNCTNLKNIKIPNSVTLLGSYAFYYCKSLTSVSLSDHLQDIMEFAFYNCTSLSNISIPNGVTSIEQFAFSACNSLTNIFIPNSVNNIGNKMFNDNVHIFCLEYSYAESWADQNGYPIEIVGPDHSIYDYLITLPSTKTVMVGSITGMDETIFPLFSDTPITWSSSDSTIVNVSENGVLTVLDTGTATITLSVGTTITECVITAIRAVESFDLIPDIYVISKKNIKVNINNIIPIDATLQLNWATGDNVYATIDQDGNISGRAVGITSLTVSDSISGLSRTSTIHICYPVSEIELSLSAEKVLTGKKLFATASVTMNTQTCINQLVTFSSSNENIAVIDQQGHIQTFHPGTVTIIATADNGISASCQLIVNEIQNILILPASLTEIGIEAFSGLPAAEAVRIPSSVTSIADDAFGGSNVIILAPYGSYAITWAQDHGFDYLIE